MIRKVERILFIVFVVLSVEVSIKVQQDEVKTLAHKHSVDASTIENSNRFWKTLDQLVLKKSFLCSILC